VPLQHPLCQNPDLSHRLRSSSRLVGSDRFLDISRLHQGGDSSSFSGPLSWTENSRQVANIVTSNTGDKQTVVLDRYVDEAGSNRPSNDGETNNSTVALNVPAARYGRSNSSPVHPKTPPSGGWLNSGRPSSRDEISPPGRQKPLRTTWRHSVGSDAFSSFLNMEEEPDDSHGRPPSLEPTKGKSDDQASNEAGVTFDELVDRLVSLPMSKHETKFSAIFLCLYRKFAAPAKLLNGLIGCFDRNERSAIAQLTRTSDQLRLLNIVAQWVSEYPEDFAYPKTRSTLLDFILALEENHVYMFAAKEISSHLQASAEEDNIGWPFRDGEVDGDSGETFLNTSARSSPSLLLTRISTSDDTILNTSSLDLNEDAHEIFSGHSATLSSPSSVGRSGSVLTQSSSTLMVVEAAQREAHMFELTQRYLLTKIQWRQFMDIPEDDFARELTRIDWIMYSSFGPRDLVRHVSISPQEKDNTRSLANVNQMIKQFNHLAFFVASMILLRDKPKHRAHALEKFISIAQVSDPSFRLLPTP
jgi:RasGEF domain/RasGEF N-terminal motif